MVSNQRFFRAGFGVHWRRRTPHRSAGCRFVRKVSNTSLLSRGYPKAYCPYLFSLACYQISMAEEYQNAVEEERGIASMLTQKTTIGEDGADSEADESTRESQSSEPLSAHESRESPDDEEVSAAESGSSSSSSGLSLLSSGEMASDPAEVYACC